MIRHKGPLVCNGLNGTKSGYAIRNYEAAKYILYKYLYYLCYNYQNNCIRKSKNNIMNQSTTNLIKKMYLCILRATVKYIFE